MTFTLPADAPRWGVPPWTTYLESHETSSWIHVGHEPPIACDPEITVFPFGDEEFIGLVTAPIVPGDEVSCTVPDPLLGTRTETWRASNDLRHGIQSLSFADMTDRTIHVVMDPDAWEYPVVTWRLGDLSTEFREAGGGYVRTSTGWQARGEHGELFRKYSGHHSEIIRCSVGPAGDIGPVVVAVVVSGSALTLPVALQQQAGVIYAGPCFDAPDGNWRVMLHLGGTLLDPEGREMVRRKAFASRLDRMRADAAACLASGATSCGPDAER